MKPGIDSGYAHNGAGGSGAQIFTRNAHRQIADQIEPEAQARKEAALVFKAIAEEPHRFVTVVFAELRWIQAQQQGIEFLRHIAPLESFWPVQPEVDPQG